MVLITRRCILDSVFTAFLVSSMLVFLLMLELWNYEENQSGNLFPNDLATLSVQYLTSETEASSVKPSTAETSTAKLSSSLIFTTKAISRQRPHITGTYITRSTKLIDKVPRLPDAVNSSTGGSNDTLEYSYKRSIAENKRKSLSYLQRFYQSKKHLSWSENGNDLWFYDNPPEIDMWDTSSGSDRILAQLAYAKMLGKSGWVNDTKEIYISGKIRPQGDHVFRECPVHQCRLVSRQKIINASAVIIASGGVLPSHNRSKNQIWIYYQLESARNSVGYVSALKNKVNWTATYRRDSTIVTPYAKYVPTDPDVLQKAQTENYAKHKTKLVAWFVSHCGTSNRRLQYANELGKYIQVDIYGSCGSLKCPRSKSKTCFEKLNKEYKFYLSFENSNCQDYITEKYFENALENNIVPIVMGASVDEYHQVSPYHSFIHVDNFSSPKALASYLNYLDKHDDVYNEYFTWKGTGTFINTRFWCRMCALLHGTDLQKRQPSQISDLKEWWKLNKCNRGKPYTFTSMDYKTVNRQKPIEMIQIIPYRRVKKNINS